MGVLITREQAEVPDPHERQTHRPGRCSRREHQACISEPPSVGWNSSSWHPLRAPSAPASSHRGVNPRAGREIPLFIWHQVDAPERRNDLATVGQLLMKVDLKESRVSIV